MNRIAKELYEEIEELYPPYYEDEMIKLCDNLADIVKDTTYDLTDVFAVVGGATKKQAKLRIRINVRLSCFLR